MRDLRELHPDSYHLIWCENGCGAVLELADAYSSYKRGSRGERLLICECCAADEGHAYEDREAPDQAPVCKRRAP